MEKHSNVEYFASSAERLAHAKAMRKTMAGVFATTQREVRSAPPPCLAGERCSSFRLCP